MYKHYRFNTAIAVILMFVVVMGIFAFFTKPAAAPQIAQGPARSDFAKIADPQNMLKSVESDLQTIESDYTFGASTQPTGPDVTTFDDTLSQQL